MIKSLVLTDIPQLFEDPKSLMIESLVLTNIPQLFEGPKSLSIESLVLTDILQLIEDPKSLSNRLFQKNTFLKNPNSRIHQQRTHISC